MVRLQNTGSQVTREGLVGSQSEPALGRRLGKRFWFMRSQEIARSLGLTRLKQRPGNDPQTA